MSSSQNLQLNYHHIQVTQQQCHWTFSYCMPWVNLAYLVSYHLGSSCCWPCRFIMELFNPTTVTFMSLLCCHPLLGPAVFPLFLSFLFFGSSLGGGFGGGCWSGCSYSCWSGGWCGWWYDCWCNWWYGCPYELECEQGELWRHTILTIWTLWWIGAHNLWRSRCIIIWVWEFSIMMIALISCNTSSTPLWHITGCLFILCGIVCMCRLLFGRCELILYESYIVCGSLLDCFDVAL